MKLRLTKDRPRTAFTLTELLVSLFIFSLLMMLLVQMTDGIGDATTQQIRQMETISSARVALDTLSQDIGALVTRGGTTMLFKSGDALTSDALRFITFSRNNAESADARMTVVTYSIEMRLDPQSQLEFPMLVRGTAPLFWPNQGDTEATDYDLRNVLRDKLLVDADIVAERVFRFEIVWLRTDGQIARDPRGADVLYPDEAKDENGYIWLDLDKVRGFIVSVVALDETNQERVLQKKSFTNLQDSFLTLGMGSEDLGKIPAEIWKKAIPEVKPAYAREGLRVMQRTYALRAD